jgi:hypothetical protein
VKPADRLEDYAGPDQLKMEECANKRASIYSKTENINSVTSRQQETSMDNQTMWS